MEDVRLHNAALLECKGLLQLKQEYPKDKWHSLLKVTVDSAGDHSICSCRAGEHFFVRSRILVNYIFSFFKVFDCSLCSLCVCRLCRARS